MFAVLPGLFDIVGIKAEAAIVFGKHVNPFGAHGFLFGRAGSGSDRGSEASLPPSPCAVVATPPAATRSCWFQALKGRKLSRAVKPSFVGLGLAVAQTQALFSRNNLLARLSFRKFALAFWQTLGKESWRTMAISQLELLEQRPLTPMRLLRT